MAQQKSLKNWQLAQKNEEKDDVRMNVENLLAYHLSWVLLILVAGLDINHMRPVVQACRMQRLWGRGDFAEISKRSLSNQVSARSPRWSDAE